MRVLSVDIPWGGDRFLGLAGALPAAPGGARWRAGWGPADAPSARTESRRCVGGETREAEGSLLTRAGPCYAFGMAQKKPARKAPVRKKKTSSPRKASRAKAAAAEGVVPPRAEPTPVPAATAAEPALPEAAIPEDTAPEVAFAARVPPAEPARPFPANRRAIFFDVENTSRPADVARLLEHVAIDRVLASTELVASGNWRVIGNETARLLARAGAHLVHSAPATGVRDWSDLRIAVSAGVWLGSARPGDQLDIVSDDKAFDAVGDVAATLGVFFRRLSYRALLRGGRPEATERAERPPRGARAPSAPRGAGEARPGGRGRRGGRGRTRRAEAVAAPAEAPVQGELLPTAPMPMVTEAAAAEPALTEGAARAAPESQLLDVVRELLQRSPNGVMLDVLANRLKALGFERPPGSPRLVTRVRSLKELDVSPRGLIRLRHPGSAPVAPETAGEETPAAGAGGEGRRRRRRGGGRGRGRGAGAGPAGSPPAPAED